MLLNLPVDLDRCYVAVMLQDERLQSVGLQQTETNASDDEEIPLRIVSADVCSSFTTGSVGWNRLKSRLQIDVGRMCSCPLLFPGRIPRNAKKTARGEPMQKKFSTCNTGSRAHWPWEHENSCHHPGAGSPELSRLHISWYLLWHVCVHQGSQTLFQPGLYHHHGYHYKINDQPSMLSNFPLVPGLSHWKKRKKRKEKNKGEVYFMS